MNLNLEEKLLDNFTEYADYVNNERAITHYYDGLKPVLRRTLYTMYNMGLTPEKQTRKCATIVGQILSYHPHGDSGVYNALVRAAQDFSLLVPVITGMGNFGSLDMGPAAMRYTEAKLSKFGYTLVEGLKDKVVPMVPNYDGTTEEPLYLPVPIPYLLVNGTSGIGVGMAASIPSHNIKDVVEMTAYFVDHPDATTEELVAKLKGPDFSTGCEIVNKEDFVNIYEQGSGSFKMRAKFSITGNQITATNLPYKVSGAKVYEQVMNAQERGECGFVKTIIDMSTGEEVVIFEVTGKDTDMMIRELCRVSDLEKSFPMDFSVVLETPQKINLRTYLQKWVETHKAINTKDLKNQEAKARARRLIVEGFLKAILGMDEIVKIIRGSENRAEARANLMELGFREVQANAILDMRLASLTKLSGVELEKEHQNLCFELDRILELLEDEGEFNKYIIKKMDKVNPFAAPRKTTLTQNVFPKLIKAIDTNFNLVVKKDKAYILEGVSTKGLNGDSSNPIYLLTGNEVLPVKSAKESIISGIWGAVDPKTKFVYHISEDGFIKKTKVKDLFTSRKAIVAKQDKVIEVLQTDTDDKYVLLTLSDGKSVQFKVDDINPTGRNARGVIAVKLEDDQKVVSAVWSNKVPGVPVGRNKRV